MSDNFDLPVSWLLVPFSDILFLKNGYAFKSDDYTDHGIPLIRISDINGTVVETKKAVKVPSNLNDGNYEVKKGDILIAMSGATTGKYGIYTENIVALQNQRVGNFKTYSKELPKKYIYYLLGRLQKTIYEGAYGGAQPNISSKKIEEILIPLPPLNEQHRVVEKIGELFSELDNGIANLKLVQNQLKVYRQALLKAAFEGKLTEEWRQKNKPEPAEKLLERIKEERQKRYENELKEWKETVKLWEKDGKKGKKPEKPRKIEFKNKESDPVNLTIPNTWSIACLNDISDLITDGTHHTPKYTESGVKFISVKDIYNERVHFDNCKYISEESHKELIKRCNPEKGDLLITKSGTIGRLALVPEEEFSLFVSVALIKLNTANKFLHDRWIYYSVKYHVAGLNIDQDIKGGLLKNYHLEDLRSVEVLICSKIEQETIIDILDSKLTVLDNVEHEILHGLKQAEILRQSILKRAFEGRLSTQNPTDEPASVLIKRIEKEKQEYLDQLKKSSKRNIKNKTLMSQKKTIIEILAEEQEPISAKALWQKSVHKEIDEFYLELKKIEEKIKEVKKGNESFLSLVK